MKSPRKFLIPTAFALLLLALLLVVRGFWESQPPASDEQPSYIDHTVDTRPSSSASRLRTNPVEADRRLQLEGVTTDAALTSFPMRDYQRPSQPAGKPAGGAAGDAYIHVPSEGTRVALQSNQIGEFPTVETRLNDTVGIRLELPDVQPGTPVRVVILDGGSFPISPGELSRLMEAAEWRGVAFEFTTSSNIGTHRVLVQAQGRPSRILDFTAIASQGS